MDLVFAAIAVAAGAAISFQSTINAGLARVVGLGPALVVNTTVVLAGAIGLWLATGATTQFFPRGIAGTLYLGGVFGFCFVAAAASVFPKLGAAWSVALIVLGQCIAALAIDHYGLFGMERVALTAQRFVGAALVALGVAVFRL